MAEKTWIEMMKCQDSILLFCSLYVRKTQRGAFSSAKEVDALFHISLENPSITPLKLSQKLGARKSIVSRLIESLHQKELIQKQYSEEDGRSYSMEITGKGRQELECMYRYYIERIGILRETMGEDWFETFMGMIAEANDVMNSKER